MTRGWVLSEPPPAAIDMWRQVTPPRGETRNPAVWAASTAAGLFRALLISALWLLGVFVATRARSGAALVLTALIVAIGAIARALI